MSTANNPCYIDLQYFKVVKTISQDETDFVILVEHNKEGQFVCKVHLTIPPFKSTELTEAMKFIETVSRIRHQTLNRFYGFHLLIFLMKKIEPM